MLATVVPFAAPSKRDRPSGLASVFAALDEAGLSTAAFRVFCHLYRLGMMAQKSLQSIGKECFSGTYPNAKAPRLRILAARAIEELEQRGLVAVDRSNAGNIYEIAPIAAWVEADPGWENPNQRQRSGKARKSSQSIGSPSLPMEPEPEPEEDEPLEITVEYAIDGDEVTLINEQSTDLVPESITEPDPAPFDPTTYDWLNLVPSEIPAEFWQHTMRIVKTIQAERDANGHDRPIGDVESYCTTMLRKNGRQRYEKWLAKQVSTPTIDTVGIHWSGVQPVMDIENARLLIKEYWRTLQLGWMHPDLVSWMRRAESFFPSFRFTPQSNFYNLPDQVVIKLCSDMQATIEARVKAGVL